MSGQLRIRLGVFAALVLAGLAFLLAFDGRATRADDKKEPEPLTQETLGKFLMGARLKATAQDDGSYEVVKKKTIKGVPIDLYYIVRLSSDNSRLFLSSTRWAKIQGPTTLPPELAVKILELNSTLAPASFSLDENRWLSLKRVLDSKGLTSDTFNDVFDEFHDTVANNLDQLEWKKWQIPNQYNWMTVANYRLIRGVAALSDRRVVTSGTEFPIQAGKPQPLTDLPILLWQFGMGKLPELVKMKGGAWCLAAHPDGKSVFAGGHEGALIHIEVEGKKIQRKFEGHKNVVFALNLSRDGKRLLSGGGALSSAGKRIDSSGKPTDQLDDTVRLWDVEGGKELKKFEGHTGLVDGVALSPDGKLAASCSNDLTARVWDVETGKELRKLSIPKEGINSLAFRSDKQVVAADRVNSVRIFDVETGNEVRKLDGHTGAVFAVAVSPDGKQALSTGYDGSVRLWDLESGRQLTVFSGHNDSGAAVAFVPGEPMGVSGGWDSSARVWTLPK
jgi:WD40 repeat protein